MRFYPHNISGDGDSTVQQAISASFTVTGSYIANFSALTVQRIDTASVGLNFIGTAAPNGTSIGIIGPTGSTGARGAQGYRGRSVFLLSSSWDQGSCGAVPGNCSASLFYPVSGEPGNYACLVGESPTTYYHTASAFAVSGGEPLYTNDICTYPATNLSPISYGGSVYITDSNATSSLVEACADA